MRKSARFSLTSLVLSCIILGLSACTSINLGQSPPDDWPKLKETVHVVSVDEMGKECARVGGFLAIPLACSFIDFDIMECNTWLTGPTFAEHEHQHCIGYDHYGSTALRDYWTKWKKEHQ